MLEDRDYMRQPEFDEQRWRPNLRLRWSWTLALIAAYAFVLIAELVTARFFPQNNFFNDYLALSKEGVEQGFVWQLVTYQFMHAGWLHWLLNSWAIYVFGRELESMLGGRRFLALVFSSGIVGGVFQVLTAMVWPALFGGGVCEDFPGTRIDDADFFHHPGADARENAADFFRRAGGGGDSFFRIHFRRECRQRRASRRHGNGLVLRQKNPEEPGAH